MKVVILCGGKGTRLREETEYKPKPMVPIGDMPILWHIMKIYAHYGHTDFILCLGYKGDVIKEWFRNLQWHLSDVQIQIGKSNQIKFINTLSEVDWNISLINTGQENMTGSRIKQIEKYIGNDPNFLLTYGDGVGDIDIGATISHHLHEKKTLTITGVRPPGRWGELVVDGNSVKNFLEKPQVSASRINGGFFVAKSDLFSYLNDDPSLIFESSPMNLLAQNDQLSLFSHNGFWQPMDTYQEYLLLNKLWNENNASWKVWRDAI
jgi:glucose-1-phosphate cytidylyltransferase